MARARESTKPAKPAPCIQYASSRFPNSAVSFLIHWLVKRANFRQTVNSPRRPIASADCRGLSRVRQLPHREGHMLTINGEFAQQCPAIEVDLLHRHSLRSLPQNECDLPIAEPRLLDRSSSSPGPSGKTRIFRHEAAQETGAGHIEFASLARLETGLIFLETGAVWRGVGGRRLHQLAKPPPDFKGLTKGAAWIG